MKNTINDAFKALKRNPGRAVLTSLGIVIGIGAVIAMMEIGKGSSIAMQEEMSRLGGTNQIAVMGGARKVAGVSMGTSSWITLSNADADAIASCQLVGCISPVLWRSGIQVVNGSKNWAPNDINGVGENYLEIVGKEIEEGRGITKRDVDTNATVCILGKTVVNELFDGNNPIGARIRIGRAEFEVVGVLKESGTNLWGSDSDDIILVPWTTLRRRVIGPNIGTPSHTTSSVSSSPAALYPCSGVALYPEQNENLETDNLWYYRSYNLQGVYAKAITPEDAPALIKDIGMLMRERHGLKDDQDDDFRIHDNKEFLKLVTGSAGIMENLLLAVALISLIVGGVGIMNIMLVSVTERTKEIGLRMAVGARSRDILKQFLVESTVLCFIGGAVGIVVGHGAALFMNLQFSWPIASSIGAVLAAVIVSVGIGLIFGFYPAWKASKLDPIEALRSE